MSSEEGPDRQAAGPGVDFTVHGGGAAPGATDSPAGTLVLASGTSTGAASSAVRIQVMSVGPSSSADNTTIDRAVYASPKTMTPTSGVATPIFSVTLPSGTSASLIAEWTVHATHTNDSDLATASGYSKLVAANKGGAVTTSGLDSLALGFTTIALNTLAVASSNSTAGSTVTFSLTPTFVLFTPSAVSATVTVRCLGSVTVALL